MISEFLDLADYRRKAHAVYSGVRDHRLPIDQRWNYWIVARNELIGNHPQSPLSAEQRAGFSKLSYYPYDPTLRFIVGIDDRVDPEILEIPLQTDGNFCMQRIGKINLPIAGSDVSLTLFRILG